MGKIKLDLSKLNQKITNAFEKTAEAYAGQLQETIQSPVFEWPGETKRENGEVVGSPRDIEDTSDFVDSQQPVVVEEKSADQTVARIDYTSDHAAVVYTGWVDAQEIYPGREWDKEAQKDLDVVKQFKKDLKKELK